jgi:hypothetical protein
MRVGAGGGRRRRRRIYSYSDFFVFNDTIEGPRALRLRQGASLMERR